MENMEQDHLTGIDINIDSDVRQQLNETSKWTKFISIVMFVACGLILIVGILGGAVFFSAFRKIGYGYLGDFSGAVLIVVIVLVVAILAVIYYFLFDFSRKIKNALIADNITELNSGLKSLKIFFIITTIFAILSLVNNISKMI